MALYLFWPNCVSVCCLRLWRNATTYWRSTASVLWGGVPSLWRGKESWIHIFWREETNKAHLSMALLSLCHTRWWTVKNHTHTHYTAVTSCVWWNCCENQGETIQIEKSFARQHYNDLHTCLWQHDTHYWTQIHVLPSMERDVQERSTKIKCHIWPQPHW